MSIQTQIDRISTANQDIKTSIVDSGVAVPEGTKLDGLAPLVGDIVGQFSDELDTIIGGDTTPVTDITARLATVNGVSGDVSTQLDTLDGTKTAIKDAIVAKGVDIPEGTVFRDYATKIGEIRAGGFSDTATIALSAPYGYSSREINYIDESFAKVSNTSDGEIQIPVPQIVYIKLAGLRETSHTYSGNAENLFSSLVHGVYYVYGDATFTASR